MSPVAHQKPARKPPFPGTIEIEIVALNLVSCTPINPGNDRIQIPFPGGGGAPVPVMGTLARWLLGAALAAIGVLVVRRRAWRASH